MANTTKELTPRQRFSALAILIFVISIVGQVFLLFFYENRTYDPGQGPVISLPEVTFQICAMLSCVGLTLLSGLTLLAIHLVSPTGRSEEPEK